MTLPTTLKEIHRVVFDRSSRLMIVLISHIPQGLKAQLPPLPIGTTTQPPTPIPIIGSPPSKDMIQTESFFNEKRKFFGKGPQSSLIISEAIEDATGKIVSCTVYRYDTNGNVEEEKLYGDFVGKEIPSIRLQSDGVPDEGRNHSLPCEEEEILTQWLKPSRQSGR